MTIFLYFALPLPDFPGLLELTYSVLDERSPKNVFLLQLVAFQLKASSRGVNMQFLYQDGGGRWTDQLVKHLRSCSFNDLL